jgi:hypothetical protein
VKSSHGGRVPSMAGNSMLQAASITTSVIVPATFATKPSNPSAVALGRGLHSFWESSILTKVTAESSSSSSFRMTFLVGTTERSVISGIYKSVADMTPSSQVGVGLAPLDNSVGTLVKDLVETADSSIQPSLQGLIMTTVA